jgi:hypothetical protein
MVSVPVRLADVVLLAAVYATEPEPVPPDPTAGVSHVALLDTDHVHPVAAETLAVAVPPLDAIDWVSGDTT